MDLSARRNDWPRCTWEQPGPCILSDDPADHGLSEAEVACIERAYELRRREVRAALKQSPSREGSEWSFGIPPPKNVREWRLWVFVLPLLFAALVLMKVVLGPLEHLADRREVVRRKGLLREELAELERPPLLRPLPERTLHGMWSVYGFERDQFEESVGVELLAAWIDRLYGPETARAVKLEARLEAVSARRARCRTDAKHIGCVLYTPRLEEVIRGMAAELPPYDWLRDTARPGPAGRVH